MKILRSFTIVILLVAGCSYPTTEQGTDQNQVQVPDQGPIETPQVDTNAELIDVLKRHGVSSKRIDRGVLVTISDVAFEFDSSNLSVVARTKLYNVSTALNDPRFADLPIAIEGYTDSRGSNKYNLELSNKRAKAVERELVFSNVAEQRITARGFGGARPLAPNNNSDGTDNPQGRAKNRRVEIVIPSPNYESLISEPVTPEPSATGPAPRSTPQADPVAKTWDQISQTVKDKFKEILENPRTQTPNPTR
ncbi:MAG: OmpA family protein [Gammaproteobacteria bacterium]|nr:OmpA family protein [Gammaproteobacteria bacterium]